MQISNWSNPYNCSWSVLLHSQIRRLMGLFEAKVFIPSDEIVLHPTRFFFLPFILEYLFRLWNTFSICLSVCLPSTLLSLWYLIIYSKYYLKSRIYSLLSKHSTARGSSTGLVTVGPTKVYKSIFPRPIICSITMNFWWFFFELLHRLRLPWKW